MTDVMPRPARARLHENPDGRPTLGDHLRELRRRLIISAATLVVFRDAAILYLYTVMSPFPNVSEIAEAVKAIVE